MKKVSYILKKLAIHKIPGFPRGMETLDDLAANINIIAGPNASGKSSTSRMIQQLIWHNKTKGLNIDGSVVLDGETWEIKIDSDKITIQRDGKDDELSGIPTSEGQHRYSLALHELIHANEDDLATEIVKQSIGGYDLDAAKQNLSYSPTIKNKAVSQYKDFNETEKKYKGIRTEQKELKKEEENLNQLYDEKEDAQHASKLSQFYEKVADFLQAKLKYDQISETYNNFSSSMGKVTGEEYTSIEDFENQLEEAEGAIEQAEVEIERSKNILEGLEIPESGINDKTISELEERITRLKDIDHDIQDKNEKIEEFITKEREALKSVDDSIDPSEWKGLNLEKVSGLDKFLQDAHTILGEKEFLLAEINKLKEEGKSFEGKKFESEKLIQGVNTLGYWLKEQTSTTGIPKWIVAASSVLGVLTVIVTYFIGWQGLFGIILIVGLLIYTYLFDREKETTLNLREQDFKKSGLTPPSQWNTENVSNRIEELIEKLKEAKEKEKIIQRLKSYNENLENLQNRLNRINKTREEWVEKLKTAPGFPETNSKDFSSMYWFLKQVQEWQDAHSKLESLKSQKVMLEDQHKADLDKINDLFVKSNFDKAKDAIEAKVINTQLKEQESTRKSKAQLIVQRDEQITEQEKQKGKASSKLIEIYQKLDVAHGEKEKVRLLVEQSDDYHKISRDHYAAEQALSERESWIKDHSLYDEKEIESLSVDQAKAQSIEFKNKADRLDDIKEKITSIETLIQSKKRGHELEDILSKKEEALNSLELLHESNLSSITGNLIMNQLKKETRDQNRPKVFKRANEIFNKITNGRYELRLEEKEEPTFKAYDTILKLGQNLSEISTGTRVQLLLSVRLAFVETQESSIKLPLLADELLANSDDERAKAMIESLIEISREGRQIFYFTAQADEVDKWKFYLDKQPDLDHKIIQLNEGTEIPINYMDFQPDLSSIALLQQVPSPDGVSHEQYGKKIRIQPFNILIQNCSELPLWYLIEDVDLLYDCLKRGIKFWGQLDSYCRNNGRIQKLNENTLQYINEKIKILEQFQELYRRGRARPIDREVLESSGTISGSFIDEVTDKLGELKGDPKKLIQALKDGKIARFRQSNTEELEQYLLSEGHLDYREVLITDEIIVQLHAFISNMNIETDDAENFINRILSNSDVTETSKKKQLL